MSYFYAGDKNTLNFYNMIEFLRKYLQKTAGLKLNFDSNGDFYFFSKMGLNYMVIFEPDKDPNYFRIILPNLYDITDQNATVMEDAINQTNLQYKVIKFTKNNNKVWAAAECFFYSYEGIEDLFARLISGLDGSANYFSGLLNANTNSNGQ